MPGKELVAVDNYAVVKQDTTELVAVMQENLGDGGLSAFDLPKVKIPTGGAQSWEVPTLDGGESVKALEGVIVYWREPRAYWVQNFDESGGGTPPDCSSNEGKIGHGVWGVGSEQHPDGKCPTCPMAEWGSDPRGGKGQACKQMRLLFMLQPDKLLPLAMFLPPTSIKPIKDYFLALSTEGIRYSSVITRLELDKAKGGPTGNIDYSVVKPSLGARLEGPALERIQKYASEIREVLESLELTQEDFSNVQAAATTA